MDQNSTDGADKRNWRERLGIGAKDGLPRIAEDFKETSPPRSGAAPQRPAANPAASPAANSVRPAPMAPRLAPRPATTPPAERTATGNPPPRPAVNAPAPRQPQVAPDALANRLKAQRDAAEKLAEQRVNAARQRAESQLGAPPSKPKFSFADPPAPAARAPQQQTTPPRPAEQPAAPQLQPARPQLGQSARPLPPSVPPSYAQVPPQRGVPPQPQQPYPRQYAPQAYPPVQPTYRPIDPNTGYTPPAYVPPVQRQNYTQPAYQPTPRLQPPARGGQGGYPPAQSDLRSNPRLGPASSLRTPSPVAYDDDQDDIFEQPQAIPGRRATAGDYQQAYRNAEPEYDEELPRSRLPLILMFLLVLALAAGIGGVWAYNHFLKGNGIALSDKSSAPVVAASDQPVKVSPDAAGTKPGQPAAQANQPAAASGKKQIYDRIVGDHEVLSGQMKSTEEAPVQPDANAAPPPPGTGTGTGNDGTPLPLPPPPGSSGGTQGSLDQGKGSDIAQITPAAEPSSAANSTPPQTNAAPAPPAAAPQQPAAASPPPQLPTPGAEPSQLAAADPSADTITDKPDATAKPGSKVADAKKPAAAKAEKSLGAKPVVLVPPAKIATADQAPTSAAPPPTPVTTVDNSLYNGPSVGAASNTTAPTVPAKRKSVADLFKTTSPTTPQTNTQVAVAGPTTSPVAGAYVAQLSSFKSKEEASQEYARLVQKHGAIISKFAPIIDATQVAGSQRYRLSIGPMASMDVATGFCSSLFAAGERDCVVHRQ